MLKRDFLSGVSGIKHSGKISGMSDAEFSDFIRNLNSFIDGFPANEKDIRNAVRSKDYNVLIRNMKGVCGVLSGIHAEEIVREYNGKINKISGTDHNNAEMLAENFIQRVSALSIDIQMALQRNAGNTVKTASWSSSRRITILAVDNAIMFLHTLEKLLKDAPVDLHCTSSCTEALEFCANNRPDVILLDIEMPEMDGYELARRIKSGGQKAPVIFITANSEREYVDKAIAAGAVGLLVKPLRINQLLEKLKANL